MASNISETVAAISTQLILTAVLFLFMVVVFISFLHLFLKHCMGSHSSSSSSSSPTNSTTQLPISHPGLNPELLKSLPVTVFTPSRFKDGLECSVCLSELSQGEDLRLRPKCNHGFHVNCIDMWFQSNSTCPLCRAPVVVAEEAEQVEVSGSESGLSSSSTDSPDFPTNVLFWGNQDGVATQVMMVGDEEGSSSSGSSMLVIDIPRRGMEMEEVKSPPPMEETKTMTTPKSGRLRSLRRLLSRGKMVVGSAGSTPRGGGENIEEGQLASDYS